jgi:hypothetical protein
MKIALKVFLILLIIPVVCFADEYEDARNAGKAAANLVRNEINTGEKINKRIAGPMTDSEAPLMTFGQVADQVAMNIEITNHSSSEFLTITASPVSTGDIRNMSIEMDTDFDGVLDSTYIVPYTISGVCANGFITCLAGTWDGCANYQWRFSSPGGIRAVLVSTQDELKGCYCINTGCNSTITFDNMPMVLKDLGGAIVGAVQSYSPNYSITRVEEGQNSIKYYGQNTGAIDINHDGYFSGVTRPDRMYNPENAAALNSTASIQTNRQSGDLDSYYSKLSSSYEAIDQPVSEKECIIRHSVNFSGGSAPVVREADSCSGSSFTGCKLMEEYVCDYNGANCVQTFDNFNPTLQKPVTYCEQMPPYTFCNSGTAITQSGRGVIYAGPETWFYIRRIYQCQEENHDYSADSEIQKAGQVMESVQKTGRDVTYEDVDPDTGAIITQKFQYPDVEEIPEYELACKIMRPIKDTNVTKDGTVSDYKRSNDSFQYIVEPCDYTGVCPIQAGDTLITDCSSITSFAEMVSIMEGLERASDDMVCSQD